LRASAKCPGRSTNVLTQRDVYGSSWPAFISANGRYPDDLAELGEVPCQRSFAEPLLYYRRTSSGYDLAFGDWLVSWHATEHGMNVMK
jgi:hypothetical protein